MGVKRTSLIRALASANDPKRTLSLFPIELYAKLIWGRAEVIIHLHATCWNEERMLPFFFRYYDRFVDRYFIHDNQSSDGSIEILRVSSAGHYFTVRHRG